MTQYELPDGFQGMETCPRGVWVNTVWDDGRYITGFWDSGDPIASRIIGWAPIVPLKAKRWRAKMGEPYYIVANGRAQVDRHTDSRDSTDEQLYELGNYFQTKQEAEAMAVKVKALYNEVMP